MTQHKVTSVYGSAQAEYVVKKSRFIAHLHEVHSEAEAIAFLEMLRKKYWDASHNCYAWQIGSTNPLQKSSDDGEPSGTAGRPILDVLKKRNITNTIAVVTRYFGGIKLGASGLIRAYSHSTALGLDIADIADYIPYASAAITVTYSFVSFMEHLMPEYNCIVTDRSFTDNVTFTCQIPQERQPAFQKAIADGTSGKGQYKSLGTTTIPVLRKKNNS